jgi:hypothetical protein
MYLGIDTHKRYSQVVVVDGDGNLQEESRLPNDRLKQLAEQYTGSEAAIEASGHCCPIYEMLDEHLDVTLVNPSKNRIIADVAVKTDRADGKRPAICSGGYAHRKLRATGRDPAERGSRPDSEVAR